MKTIIRLTVLLALMVGVCLAQGTQPGLTIQIQNAGTPVLTAKKYLVLNCVSGLTCSYSGGVLGITAGGAGSRQWQACGSRGIGDGLNAIPAGTYLQFACVNDTGSTVTITGVHCWTDNAGTSSLNAANNAATALLGGAITCNATKASGGAAGTQSAATTLANGDAISFTFVADGTSKQANWTVSGTY